MVWNHAIDIAFRYDKTRPHRVIQGTLPSSASEYAKQLCSLSKACPTVVRLLWVCRVSRQVFLEDWKRPLKSVLSSYLCGNASVYGDIASSFEKALKTVEEEQARLKK